MYKSKYSWRVGNGACVEKLGWRWGRVEEEELAEAPPVRSVKGHCRTRHVTCTDLLHAHDGVWQHLYVRTASRKQVNVQKQPACRDQGGLWVTFRINGNGPLQAPTGFTVKGFLSIFPCSPAPLILSCSNNSLFHDNNKTLVYLYHLFPGCNHEEQLSYMDVCHQHIRSWLPAYGPQCFSSGVFRRGEPWLRRRRCYIAAGVGVCKVPKRQPGPDGSDCDGQVSSGGTDWVTADRYKQAAARSCLHCWGVGGGYGG